MSARTPRRPAAAFLLPPILLVAFASIGAEPTRTTHYDLIIRNGTVFDGTGAAGTAADIGIVGDRIVRVGRIEDATATMEEDARGLYVAPGFISVHDHTIADAYETAESLLTQGITTAITNADGRGEVSPRAQFSRAEDGLGINFGVYIGFNSVWQATMGLNDRRPTRDELERMRSLVAAGFAQGAWGLSAGLDYKPAYFATTAEVISIAAAASSTRSNFPNHERLSDANGKSSLAGIAETVTIGEASGLLPVITHMKLQGKDRGKIEALFGILNQAMSRGHYVGADAYPYTYGFTGSVAQLLLPAWAQQGGREATLARLAQPDLRQSIAGQIEQEIATRWTGVDGVFLPKSRQRLKDVMHALGNVGPGEAVIRVYEAGDEPVILGFGTEEDLVAILKDPRVAISCDCGSLQVDYGHPRYWGAFPRFLGRYVREQGIVSWGEAVRKMTALPATMIGMTQRGYLLPGMIADITIFDPRTVIDRATIQQPVLPSEGIRGVIVNGRFALRAGKTTHARAGKLLLRSQHMPSRPMNFDVRRSVTAQGVITTRERRLTVSLRVSQEPDAPRPTGYFRALDAEGRMIIEMKTPGILQTASQWASVTGMGRSASGPLEPVTVIVEEADPSLQGASTMTVSVSGQQFSAILDGKIRVLEQR